MSEQNQSSKSIMFMVIAVAALLVVAAVPLSMIGKGSAPAGSSDEADLRIQPVAKFELQKAAAPAAASGKPRDGATVYSTVCQACHASGAAGAPKAGDKAAWAPRIGQGMATLIKNATNGKNAMPPKGGAADLSDAELKAAVEHLVGLAK